MKNLKLTSLILCEIFISILVILLLLLDMVSSKKEYDKIEIEVLPITYTYKSELKNKNAEIFEQEDEVEKASREAQEKLNEINNIKDKKEWYLSYKDLIDSYSDILDAPETVYDYYTEDEIYLIQRCVETECHGGDFNSKCNIASVVFNRVNDSEFGNNVVDVITAENQFDYWRKTISEDTKLAVEYAFAIEDTTDGCIAFRSGDTPEKWYTTETNYWTRQFIDDVGHGLYK